MVDIELRMSYSVWKKNKIISQACLVVRLCQHYWIGVSPSRVKLQALHNKKVVVLRHKENHWHVDSLPLHNLQWMQKLVSNTSTFPILHLTVIDMISRGAQM